MAQVEVSLKRHLEIDMKPENEPNFRHNAEAINHSHRGDEPDWKPATQPDSIIGFDAQTGEPLTKAELFPDVPNLHPPLPKLEPVEESVPKTALEHLQADGSSVEALDLDQDPRQYEPDDGPGGWQGQKPQRYKGDLKG